MSFPELYNRPTELSSEDDISTDEKMHGAAEVSVRRPIRTSGAANFTETVKGSTVSGPGNGAPGRVIVIAHRGASYDYPENTMIAFQKAFEMGADMIELDILLSSDGVPVVFHDSRIDAKTSGKGTMVEYTLNEIREIDAGSWFHSDYFGTRIPTLEEVLEWASGRISLNIEIKSEAVTDRLEGGIEEKALNLVKQYGMERHVLFSSFSYPAIEHIHQLDPEIPTGVLYNDTLRPGVPPVDLVTQLHADAFHCHRRELSGQWRRSLLESHIPILVYTVNRKWQMRRLIWQGVTGIFTDRPDRLRKIVDAASGTRIKEK